MRRVIVLCALIGLCVAGEVSDGGWVTDEEHIVAEDGPCTIKRRDAIGLSQREFIDKYAYTEPVIIYNIRNVEFSKRTQRDRMLADWSDKPVVLNSANTYSYARVQSTFGEYLEKQLKPQSLSSLGNETLYLFGDIDQTMWAPLLMEYEKPGWHLPDHEPALSFGIAGAGTGVPFHFHGPGFAEVIHGAKRWFLLPYDERPEFDPDRTTLQWYLEDYPKLPEEKRPLECLMRPGELIYFPDKWWHATLNTRTSVFISTFLSRFKSDL